MAENIIQVLKDAFTDKAIDAISRNLGEDALKTKTGLTAIIPTVLGGVLGRSANATSAQYGGIQLLISSAETTMMI